MESTGIPKEYRRDLKSMPQKLHALLEAELAAGNSIVEVGHSFPAPPIGAYVKLKRLVSTRPRESGGGLEFYARETPYYSAEWTDEKRFYFILEPPDTTSRKPRSDFRLVPTPNSQTESETTSKYPSLERFTRSMVINYEKWHDGIGYDIEALVEATPRERLVIENMLIARNPFDWRDIEALHALNTPRSRAAIKSTTLKADWETRIAAIRYAKELFTDEERESVVVGALHDAVLYGGLSQTLDLVVDFHPQGVVSELLRGVEGREGWVAVLFAGMLLYIYGKAEEPFDWGKRPFLLRFNEHDAKKRHVAYLELCKMIGVKPDNA